MKSRNTLNLITAALIGALGVTACSQTSGGSGGTAVKGMITGFGSIFVNGVEYDTTGTAYEAEGSASDENAMQVGMVVTLVGTVNPDGVTGKASAVSFADEVEGVVIANNVLANNTLNIMGQTVHVDSKTRFKSYDATHTLNTLPTNVIAEVSGYPSGTGDIFATRIEVKKAFVAGDELEVKGVVATLNATAKTFMLGGLTVDYSAASLPSNLANGLYVEVKSKTALVGTTLAANKVEVEDDGKLGEQGDEGEEAELLGTITSVGTGQFTLNGQIILTNDKTEYGDKLIPTSGMEVKVEVEYDANGNAVAKSIEREEGDGQASTELKNVAIQSIDLSAGSITIGGTAYYVSAKTIYEDESAANDKYIRIDKLAAANTVSIEYYLDPASGKNMIIALERK